MLAKIEYSETSWQTVEFFAANFTIIDFTIVGIGLFLLFYQIYLFWFPGKILSRLLLDSSVKEEKEYRQKRLELELRIVSSFIEILPILGIMGTVWGIMSALAYIRTVEAPTINIIAQRLAPALSTTFFGLVFAASNLVIFNFLAPYFEELLFEPEKQEEVHQTPSAATANPSDGFTHKTTIIHPQKKTQSFKPPHHDDESLDGGIPEA